MKILYFVAEDWYFVSHRLVLAAAALDQGWEAAVVARTTGAEDEIRRKGVRVIPLPMKRGRANPLKDLFVLGRLIRILYKEKPDLVHNVAMKPSIYGSLAAWVAGVPVVVNALGGLGYVFISSRLHVRCMRSILGFAFRFFFNRKNNILILQNADDRGLLRNVGIAVDRIRLIPGSGVDLSGFSPSPEPDGIPLVLLASRMLRDKGVCEFVQAARILGQPGLEAKMVLVGNPDPENPASIPERVLKEWVEEGVVEWWGRSEDMPSVFSRCHIACLPSYREGFPKVLMEAAACGLPLVATDVPGCREAVRHGDNGLLVPPRDARALARALETLIRDPDLRRRMGRRSREIAEAEFGVEQVVARHMELYQELLAS